MLSGEGMIGILSPFFTTTRKREKEHGLWSVC